MWYVHHLHKEFYLLECFDLAAGQGIYFATQASTSLSYTQPDSKGQRHMFMGKER